MELLLEFLIHMEFHDLVKAFKLQIKYGKEVEYYGQVSKLENCWLQAS